MKLDSIRRDYKYAALNESDVDADPIKQFGKWITAALRAEVNEATAMALSTVNADGLPQSRIVLLKDFNEQGFTFFTNYQSEKGRAIAHHPAVSLHFFWPELERQIRISGLAEKTSDEVSSSYFLSRPVLSQIAAIASDQSQKIPSRNFLEKRFEQLKEEALMHPLTWPKYWGGYVVKPLKIEFWQGRESRLHDRILYEKKDESWTISRLAP